MILHVDQSFWCMYLQTYELCYFETWIKSACSKVWKALHFLDETNFFVYFSEEQERHNFDRV